MEKKVPSTEAVWEEVSLFPQWQSHEAAARARWARLASVALHALVISLLAFTPLGRGPVQNVARALIELKEPFTLVAPPA